MDEVFDCILGVGCFGIFNKDYYKKTIFEMDKKLISGGKLIIISWFDENKPQNKLSLDDKPLYLSYTRFIKSTL